MIRTILRPNFVRQFSHTHSRTIFPENNKKNIEELIRQQNQQLKDINKNITWACFTLTTSSIAINCIR